MFIELLTFSRFQFQQGQTADRSEVIDRERQNRQLNNQYLYQNSNKQINIQKMDRKSAI